VTLLHALRQRRSDAAASPDVWIVVGLGNPGPEYAATRHNVGYLVCDLMAERLGVSLRAHRSRRADVAEGRLGALTEAVRVVAARPRSYMNHSGGAVSALLAYYKVPAQRLVVVHDELDLPFGTLRVKYDGGDNGHNGLKSIRSSLGTGSYHRVRIGIGRPPESRSAADFVLQRFSAAERRDLPGVADTAANAVESLLLRGLTMTQSDYNG